MWILYEVDLAVFSRAEGELGRRQKSHAAYCEGAMPVCRIQPPLIPSDEGGEDPRAGSVRRWWRLIVVPWFQYNIFTGV